MARDDKLKRIDKIVREVDRLVVWMLQNKPENRVIRMYDNDYKYLMRADLCTLERGFHITEYGVSYKGYDLLPFNG